MSKFFPSRASRIPDRASLRGILALLMLCAIALGPAAPAQEQPAEAVPASEPQPPPEPETIPLAEIAQRFDETTRRLRTTDERIAPDPNVDAIDATLPEKHAELEKHASSTTTLVAQGPSLNTLEAAERDWDTRKEELDLWRKTLTDRVAALEKEIAELDALRKLWERAAAQARKQSAPAAVLERTGTAITEVRAAKERVEARRNTVLDLQDRVAKEEAVVQGVLAQLHKTQQAVRGHLLQPDGPPLWTAVWRLGSGERIMAPLREVGAQHIDQLGEFARRSREHRAPLAILAAILCAATFALRKRVRRWSDEDPDLGRAIHIFDRPVSIALLAIILILYWIYPHAPDALRTLLTALMVIPVLRLLPPLIDRAFHPMLYALVAFYVTDSLREMLETAIDLERVAFAVEVNAAVVVFAWLMRPARLREIPSTVRLPRYLGWALRALLFLLLASFFANLFGYVSLSRILGRGPLRSAYVAVVLYSGAQVARAVLQVVLHTNAARSLGVIRKRGSTVLQWSSRLVALGAAAWWAAITLSAFALFDTLVGALRGVLDASLGLGTIEVSVRDVVSFGLVIVAAVVLSRLTRFVLEEDVYPRTPLQRGVTNAISTLLHYSVLMLGFLLALGAAGIEMGRFALLAGAFGVGLGFGLQNIVNNFVSGLILLFERPIQVGDTIQLTDLMGEVRHIGIRASIVRTFDGAEVIVPNGSLISDQVINWTRSDRERRIVLPVGVAYGTDPERVLALLLEAAKANPNVLSYPEPQALFDGFGDSSLDFRLRVWVHFEVGLVTRSELAVAVNAALREAGIEIPFPQRDLHLRSVDAAAGEALAERRGDGAPQAPRPAAREATKRSSES